MRWALIITAKVANVIEQDTQPTIPGQWILCGNAGPGWGYDGVSFTAPAQAKSPFITHKAFWLRFTTAERETLQGILAIGTQGHKNKLNAFRDYLAQDDSVDLTDAYIVASVNLMETATILAAGRAATILAL